VVIGITVSPSLVAFAVYMANGPVRHGTGPCQHGPIANGPARHALSHGPCLRPRHGPMGRFPCRAGPRSTTRITGRASPWPVTLCIHKQITVHSFIIHTFTVHINTSSQFLTFTKSKSKTYLIQSHFHTFTESKSKCPIHSHITVPYIH